MKQVSKDLLNQARHDLVEGMDSMKSFDFSGAYTWFLCVRSLLVKLQDEEDKE